MNGPDGPVCPQSDLPKAWCAHCRPDTEPMRAVVDPEERGPIFVAQYTGTCGVCNERIRPGTTTARLRGSGYACEDCIQ